MVAKSHNQIDVNNLKKILNWFCETCLRFASHSKHLFLTYPQGFDTNNFTAITNLFNNDFLSQITFVNYADIKELALDYFATITNATSVDSPGLNDNPLNQTPILVIYNFTQPLTGAELWYLNHHIVYSRLIYKQCTVFFSDITYPEFLESGKQCPDFEYANYALSFPKLVRLINSCLVDLNLFFRETKPPALTSIELLLIQKLHEKKIPITIGANINEIPLYISLANENVKLSLEIDPLSHFDSIAFQSSLAKQHLVLVSMGWQIIRFTSKEIQENIDECISIIESALNKVKINAGIGKIIDNNINQVSKVNFNTDSFQRKSLDHKCGPALTKGIAGTGKTTIALQKVLELINQGINPEKIIFFFNTSNNLRQGKAIFETCINKSVLAKLNLTTFYDFGMRFAKENTSSIKRKIPIKIENNNLKVLAKILNKVERDIDPDFREVFLDLDEFVLHSVISFYKANLLNPEQVKERISNKIDELVYKIYQSYEEQLQRSNRIDKDDLIKLTAQVLASNETIAFNYQKSYDYIFCDDYQEITLASDLILRLLSFPQDNLFLFGDPYNCLNQVTGSLPGLINNINIKLPNCQIYKLEHNWRIPPQIHSLTQNVISLISPDQSMVLSSVTTKTEDVSLSLIGPKFFHSEVLESQWIAEEIDTLLDTGRSPDEITVLFRNSAYAALIADALDQRNISYLLQNIDTNTLPDEEADIIAFLKLIWDPEAPKARESFEKLLPIKIKDVDTKQLSEIASFAENNNLSYLKAIEIYSKLHKDAISNELAQIVKYIFSTNKQNLSPYAAIESFCDKFKLLEYYKTFKIPKEVNYEPLKKHLLFKNSTSKFKTISEFLDALNKSNKDNTTKSKKVNLLNLHESQGLEFNIVFIPGLAEGYFPSAETESITEEYSLLYVGMSRTKEFLYLSVPLSINEKETVPSSFLAQLKLDTNTGLITKPTNPINTVNKPISMAVPLTANLPGSNTPKATVTNPQASVNAQSGVNTPTGTNPQTSVNAQSGVNTPTGANPPTGTNPQTSVNAQSGVNTPTSVNEQTGQTSPSSTANALNQASKVNQYNPSKLINQANTESIAANASPDLLIQSKSAPPGSNNTANKPDLSMPVNQSIPQTVPDKPTNYPQTVPANPTTYPQSLAKMPQTSPATPISNNPSNSPAQNMAAPKVLGKPICPQCNNQLEANSQFCGECGYRLPTRIPSCKACNEPIDPQAKFCGECGFKIIN